MVATVFYASFIGCIFGFCSSALDFVLVVLDFVEDSSSCGYLPSVVGIVFLLSRVRSPSFHWLAGWSSWLGELAVDLCLVVLITVGSLSLVISLSGGFFASVVHGQLLVDTGG